METQEDFQWTSHLGSLQTQQQTEAETGLPNGVMVVVAQICTVGKQNNPSMSEWHNAGEKKENISMSNWNVPL